MDTNRTPLLGHLLVEKGFITEAELADALRLHEETGKPLGAILTEDLGLISVPTLADTLLLQQRWRPLGEMLVESTILTEEQLLDALDDQERTGEPLGEVVRRRYHLSQSMLDRLLDRQRNLQMELERGYGSGLRRALLERRRDAGVGDEAAGDDGRGVGLSERVELGRSGADPHAFLATKALAEREGKLASMAGRVEEQRSELERMRDVLHERQLTIIELEQRVAELEALLAAAAVEPPAVTNGR